MEVINIVMSAVTTSIQTETDIINMCFIPDQKEFKTLYVETSDLDMEKIMRNENLEEAFSHNQLKSVIETNQIIEDMNVQMIKNTRVVIAQHIRNYLEEMSKKYDKIIFWVNEHTLWSQFLEFIYGSTKETIQIPEYIDFQPIDINSIIRISNFKNGNYDYGEDIMNMDESYTISSLQISSFLYFFLKEIKAV